MKRTLWIGLVGLTAACSSLFLMRPSADEWIPPSQPAMKASAASEARDQRAPCAQQAPLREAFFGDLHVHTAHSMDARSRDMLGTPDDAYRFARGETIGFGPFDASGRGLRAARLERPLDFAAVTDHAEWIGEVGLCTTPGSLSYASEPCQRYRGELPTRAPIPGLKFSSRMVNLLGVFGRKEEICGPDGAWCRESLLTAWQSTQVATERWNDTSSACAFTAFHGWEHSYSVNQSKVHRNVIFRTEIVPELPISSLEAPEAIDLWDRLDTLCNDNGSGCEALTIPHNPNVSNGRLFQIAWANESKAEQRRQASVRARIEPVVEMMQIKGESECKNGLFEIAGGEDELCDFEKIRGIAEDAPDDCGEGIGSGALTGDGCQSRVDFARYALVEGLREQERIGINPFRIGFAGSTDAHNANPGDVEEYSYQGCCASNDATPEVRLSMSPPGFAGRGYIARNPGGLMGIWAEENTRDALFDAIQRRETFATSGPRITPRFFAGWDYPDDLCDEPDLVARADAEGVPMGGVLASASESGRSPILVASVSRDPGTPEHPGGLLDRMQIIKVWHGEDGRFHQQVHDVAGRLTGDMSREPATVDLATCEPRGAGADSLCAVWRDPAFDPEQSAAYYVRAVENPSCRWSWWECLRLPESERPEACRDPSVPRLIQERVWTSPIWYEAPSAEPGRARAS